MPKLYIRILRLLKKLADFRQPQFRHLHYINIVVEAKSILLLTWHVTHTNKICIQPGKFIYRTAETAVLCNLPTGIDAIRITLYNCWRSRTVQLPLKPIPIDPETLRYLDDRFLDKSKLANLTPAANIKTPLIQTPKVAMFMKIYLRSPEISINQIQLTNYAT